MSRAGAALTGRLAARLRTARVAARPGDGIEPTQRWLAGQFYPPRSAQQISSWERGVETPSMSALADLFGILRAAQGIEANATDFAEWLTDWTIAMAGREQQYGNSALLEDSLRQLATLVPSGRLGGNGPLSSLADFPRDGPLTIILGDRREPKATSAADCLIYSGSTADVMNINALGRRLENVTIRSDEMLLRLPEERLRRAPEIAESDLLVIGSPAVNWAARILNEADAIFPFRFDHEVVERDKKLRTDIRMRDKQFAGVFWDLASTAEIFEGAIEINKQLWDKKKEEHGSQLVGEAVTLVMQVLANSTAKAMTHKFRSMGILDPADQEHHAQITYASNDFAVVTLARNPWSKSGRHRAVICAGIHGPGTTAALRELLVHPERFETHPLGAVLEVHINRDLDWLTPFQAATVEFQTREYSARNVLDHLRKAVGNAPDERIPAFRHMRDDALRARAEFVASIVEDGA